MSYRSNALDEAFSRASIIRESAKKSVSLRAVSASNGRGLSFAATGANSTTFGLGLSSLGIGDDLSQHEEQYKHFTGWPYSSIKAIAQRIAGQPVKIARKLGKQSDATKQKQSRRNGRGRPIVKSHDCGDWVKQFVGGDANQELEILEDHPLLQAIEDPNEIMVTWTLLFQTVASLELTGKAFWWVTIDEETGKIRIWPLPSSWMQPRHSDDQLYSAWEYRPTNGGAAWLIPGEQVAYFYYPDPSDPLGAISPLQAQANAVVADEAIQTSQGQMFENGIFPGYAVIAGRMPDAMGGPGERPALDAKQRNQLTSAIRLMYGKAVRNGEPLILDALIQDIKRISNSPHEMDFLNSGTQTKARIMQGFGVNPIVVGEIQGSNRAAAAVADDNFCSTVINPKITLISQVMTAWLGYRYQQEKLLMWIEPCRANDPELRLQEGDQLLKACALTRNELRQRHGYPPIEGGDTIAVPATMFFEPVGEQDLSRPEPVQVPAEVVVDDEDDEGSGDPPLLANPDSNDEDDASESTNAAQAEERSAETTTKSRRNFRGASQQGQQGQQEKAYSRSRRTKIAAARIWLRGHRARELDFAKAFKQLLDKQYEAVMKRYGKLAESDEPLSGNPAEVAGDLFDPSSWEQATLDAAAKPFAKAMITGAMMELDLLRSKREKSAIRAAVATKASQSPTKTKAAAATLDVDVAELFDVDLPANVLSRMQSHLTETFKQPYWSKIGTTTANDIRDVVEQGIVDGESGQQVAKKLQGVLGPAATRKRAMKIARTEATGALNAGQQAARDELAELDLLKGKEWLPIIDSRTRHSHANMAGIKVLLPEENFTVGGYKAPYPGHWSLPAKERVFCRCTTLSITIADDLDEDETGAVEAVEPEPVTFGPSTANVSAFDAAFIATLTKDKLGKEMTPEDIASAVGAPPDAEFSEIREFAESFVVKFHGPGYKATRQFMRYGKFKKRMMIYNVEFKVEDEYQGKGLGATVFGRQAENAARLGFGKIETYAFKGAKHNGYYTWPRFGYDASLPAKFRKLLPKALKAAKRLSDLMKSEEGRNWWSKNGDSIDATFDLRDGSLSRQVLAEYLMEKRDKGKLPGVELPNPAKSIPPTKTKAAGDDREEFKRSGVETIDLDDEDEAILDAIWDRRGAAEALGLDD